MLLLLLQVLQVANFLHGLQLDNSFVRIPLWEFLDSMENSLILESGHMLFNGIWCQFHSKNWIVVPSVLIAWLRFISIHELNIQMIEITIYIELICKEI